MSSFTSTLVATKFLPVFLVIVLFNTAPFWATLIQYYSIKEKITRNEAICMFGCFIGIIVLGLAKIDSESSINNRGFYIGIGMIINSAIGLGATGVLTRKMKTLHFSII